MPWYDWTSLRRNFQTPIGTSISGWIESAKALISRSAALGSGVDARLPWNIANRSTRSTALVPWMITWLCIGLTFQLSWNWPRPRLQRTIARHSSNAMLGSPPRLRHSPSTCSIGPSSSWIRYRQWTPRSRNG
jgi:hypothetical protein